MIHFSGKAFDFVGKVFGEIICFVGVAGEIVEFGSRFYATNERIGQEELPVLMNGEAMLETTKRFTVLDECLLYTSPSPRD